jgi:hypothetical protein
VKPETYCGAPLTFRQVRVSNGCGSQPTEKRRWREPEPRAPDVWSRDDALIRALAPQFMASDDL